MYTSLYYRNRPKIYVVLLWNHSWYGEIFTTGNMQKVSHIAPWLAAMSSAVGNTDEHVQYFWVSFRGRWHLVPHAGLPTPWKLGLLFELLEVQLPTSLPKFMSPFTHRIMCVSHLRPYSGVRL